MTKNEKGVFPYKGTFDCIEKSVRREGVTGLWVGYPTYYCRVAPHAMVALLVLDYLHLHFASK